MIFLIGRPFYKYSHLFKYLKKRKRRREHGHSLVRTRIGKRYLVKGHCVVPTYYHAELFPKEMTPILNEFYCFHFGTVFKKKYCDTIGL